MDLGFIIDILSGQRLGCCTTLLGIFKRIFG